jgi:hypothetical protein
MKSAILLCTVLSLSLSSLLSGCGEVRQAYDCRRICSRYADCVSGDQDVRECTQTCRDQDGQEFEAQATECQQCIDDGENDSCVEDAFQCGDECVGVVP